MNIPAWVASLEKEFYKWGMLNAYPKHPAPYIDVLDAVQGMTTPSTMHLLNLAVRQLGEGECYLEVGTWRGATLIGALLGNEGHGVAVDDDTMNDHDGDARSSCDVWWENVERLGVKPRVQYVSGSVPEAWGVVDSALFRRPVGVYLFDGDKSTPEAAYAGLVGVLPFLADEAILFVDDANEINIRMAVSRLVRAHNLFTIMDIPTPGNCWPCFWNGIMALAWKK